MEVQTPTSLPFQVLQHVVKKFTWKSIRLQPDVIHSQFQNLILKRDFQAKYI
jgi:hypothetical protein